MKTKRIMMTVLLSLLALSFVFAEGQAETKTDNGLTHIEMWYNATQTEVGPLPDDWVGYDILRDEFGIELEAYSLPSNTDHQEVKIRAAMAADELPDFFVASRAAFLDLVKAGMVAEKLGENAKALGFYETIQNKYPQSIEGYEIDKYISRVQNK